MMHSPAIGVGYFFWLRLRWALAGVLASTLLLAMLVHLFAHAEFLPAIQCVGSLPMIFATIHFLGVFTYGPSDFGASTSGFPRYMLVQPARAAGLVGWPMLYGTVITGVMWILVLSAIVGPAGLRGPAAPYGGFAIAAVAWFQAAAWCSFPAPPLRSMFTIAVILLLVLAGAGMKYLVFSRTGTVASYGAFTLAAYGFGVVTLWRARHGEGQTWNVMAIVDRFTSMFPRRATFPSARRAQLWYELRRNSLYLPGLILMILVPLLLPLLGGQAKPLYIAEHTINARLLMVVVMLAMPIFLAGAFSLGVGKFDFWSNKVPTFTSFFATRAYATADFVFTKWIAAAISSLMSWSIVLIFFALFLFTSTVEERALMLQVLGGGTGLAIVRVVLIFVLLVFMTWGNQVTGFYIPMYGRGWFTVTMSLVGWLQFAAIVVVGYCLYHFPAARTVAGAAMAWMIWAVAILKVVIAAYLIRILRQTLLVSASTEMKVWIAWSAAAIALLAILLVIWGFRPLSLPAVILLMPMNRIALAPLTLRANRHR